MTPLPINQVLRFAPPERPKKQLSFSYLIKFLVTLIKPQRTYRVPTLLLFCTLLTFKYGIIAWS